VKYLSAPLQRAAALAVKYSGLKLFEHHTVLELLWGYQPKFPYIVEHLLNDLGLIPTWGIYVGVR